MKQIRCPRCKLMYEYEGLPPSCCPECYLNEEEEYQMVRSYVKEHPGITVFEVCDALGVPHYKIIRYLKEEKLETLPSATSFLKCQICGKIINTGVRCDDCKKRHGHDAPVRIGKLEKVDTQMHTAGYKHSK